MFLWTRWRNNSLSYQTELIFFPECVESPVNNCQYACSEHCINQTCDKENGKCSYGCTKDKTCEFGISYNFLNKNNKTSRRFNIKLYLHGASNNINF